MHDKNARTWTDPDDGVIYDLSHMESFITDFEVKLSKSSPVVKTPVKIVFSNHCFSRKKTDEDNESQVITVETKRDGTTEYRVFCPTRWEFSKRLPEILSDLSYRSCLEG
ncbi:hypothetical protein P3388_26125, partial [Vibrio parahaemolyticus]|nr:hypothetical protein [Vibrio parahaemolyticus]